MPFFNTSSFVAGRTVTYVPALSTLAVQAVIVELRGPQLAELDSGELVALANLTLLVTDEQWRPIVGFADRYMISSHGKVVSLSYGRSGRQRLLRATSPQRYPSVTLHQDAQPTQIGLNRLVAQHFLPPPAEARFTHLVPKDGNHLNLRADNLQWVDQREQEDESVRERFRRYEDRNANSKLTPELIRQIRQLAAQGSSNKELATQFGVSRPAISLIVRRLSWRTI